MTKHQHGGDIYRRQYKLDFSTNCNPLGLAPAVARALAEAVPQMVHYPDVECEKLREAIGIYEDVHPDMIFCGNGAAEVIFSLCLAGKPHRALLPAPTFAEYQQALESVDCQITYYRLREEEGFAFREDILEELREKKPDMFFLCNPNNPTGVLTSKRLLLEIAEVCQKKHILFVVDECFLDFIREPECCTIKELLTRNPYVFILKAFTKRYAMAGVRLGYGLSGNKALLQKMSCVTQPWNVSGLAQTAGIAALQEADYVEEGRQLIFKEAAYLKKEMAKLGLKLYESAANYIFFRGPENLGESLRNEGILIRDCSNYHNLSEGY